MSKRSGEDETIGGVPIEFFRRQLYLEFENARTPAADRKVALKGGGANKTEWRFTSRFKAAATPRAMTGMNSSAWPALAYEDWADTCNTLHLWTQVVGKVKLALAPLRTTGGASSSL